jgi:hypothetical protein
MQTSHVSCGVLEVGSLLDNMERNAWEIANRLYHPAHGSPEAFIMASDYVRDEEGRPSRSGVLMAYLEDNKMVRGVRTTPAAINPKSGNVIAVMVGTINHDEFKKWYKEESIRKLEARIG